MVFIDIIIPTLNEEKYLRDCLISVLRFRLPESSSTNIFIVDGGSVDNTVSIIEEYTEMYSNIHFLKNPNRIQPSALNIALNNSSGQYVMRLDAHSTYPMDYLLNCYNTSIETNADNVGGVFIPVVEKSTFLSTIVLALTTHRFGVGNGEFRVSNQSKFVDTVPYGFFNRLIFKKIGLFDERAFAIEDFEFNSRIRKFGGKIYLNSEIQIFYYNQTSLISFFKKQFLRDGPGNAYLWYIAPYAFALRHSVPLFFFLFICLLPVSFLISSHLFNFLFCVLMFYFGLAIGASIQQALRLRNIFLAIVLPFCFFTFHFIYGLGTLTGLFKLAFHKAPYIHFNPNLHK